ncbi:hypothetical protein E1B28_007587 [Marasmius oreades]|uniref:PH domain-containing protein n=1 Tax=Marasmius oreades TaxID=181124 RepID=A0A9P7S1V0_9AGAR|nr:uncharacterized protein E1B28_007587 [Marasmius oreades]KAG7093954.1 hypothetical protein E1B28_007587 [Marasmius oreades]
MSALDSPPRTHELFSSLCHRLLSLNLVSLPEFATFEDDPVTGIRDTFSLGTPLVTLYNLLPPHYPRINLDLEVFTGDEHCRRLAVALFSMNVEQFLHCERFSYNDLQDMDGLRKAALAVHLILDKCSEAGLLAIARYPYPRELLPSVSQIQPTRSEEQWNEWVEQTVTFEREYIEHIALLEGCSKALAINNVLDQKIIDHVLPKKFFTFTRKMCVRMECTRALPWQQQCWGRLFTGYAEDIGIMYRIYCVNTILARERLLSAILEVSGLKVTDLRLSNVSIAQLLETPFRHLSQYVKQLEALIPISASIAHSHHTTLVVARDMIRRKLHSIVTAQEEATTKQKLASLKLRILDWKGLDPSNPSEFGFLLCEDQLLLRKNGVLRTLWIFLFRNILIYCDETLPEPGNSSRRGKRKLSTATVAPSPAKDSTTETNLDMKGYIHIARIKDISTSTMIRTEESRLRVYNALLLSTDIETIALAYPSKTQMHEWHQMLEGARSASTPMSMASVKALAKVYLDDVSSTFMIALSYPVRYDDLMANIEMKMRRLGFLQTQSDQSQYQRHLVVDRVAGNGLLVRVTSNNDDDIVEAFFPGSITELHVQKW